MKILIFKFLKRSNCDAFFRSSIIKTEKKIRVGYVHIEESFDTIFNIDYGSGNSPMYERVKLSAHSWVSY